MYVAHVVVTALVAYFLTRILKAFRINEERMLKIEADQRQLALMTTLSANAAHELGTPLSTISLVVDELRSTPIASEMPGNVRGDLNLIASEVLRCKAVLDGLSVQSGGVAAGEISWVSIKEICDALSLRAPEKMERVRTEGDLARLCKLQLQPLLIALDALITNALQASVSSQAVELKFDPGRSSLHVSVRDFGCGMSPVEVEQARQPFFTSKQEGMGLGLYLADLVARQFGGELFIISELSRGTTVQLVFPCSIAEYSESEAA
jgi:two-component system, sensor histidine kinase RegB